MNEAKQTMRRAIRARLGDLSTADVAAASRRVCDRLLADPAVLGARHLSLFAGAGGEIDLMPVALAMGAAGCRLYYPRFERSDRTYRLAEVRDPEAELRPGHYGLLEPAPEAALIDELTRMNELVWLVPGLAFDEQGGRLGQGGGYYDRFLARTCGCRIAVAHDWQVVVQVPTEDADQDVNRIVTDQRTIVCQPVRLSR